jgi:hypothetical protein
MKVLADLHHFDLYHSFQLLFEERLGWELYRPIGYDWMDDGYWNICDGKFPAVYQGYLSIENGFCARALQPYWSQREAGWARFATELVRVGEVKEEGDTYLIKDLSKDIYQRGITLTQFKDESFDIIISSVPQHFQCFEDLRERYQPQAFHIFHIGSIVGCSVPPNARNVMTHAFSESIPSDANYVIYDQEFSTDTFFYTSPNNHHTLKSYVHFPESQDLWEAMNIDWDFSFVGKTLADLGQTIIKSSDLAKCIQDSSFTWHIKLGGESYGHILHNSYACGRPVVINGFDYIGSRGERLLEDMVTCIDVTRRTPGQLREKLLYAGRPDVHRNMCKESFSRFSEVVNFDEDFINLKLFLQRLK